MLAGNPSASTKLALNAATFFARADGFLLPMLISLSR